MLESWNWKLRLIVNRFCSNQVETVYDCYIYIIDMIINMMYVLICTQWVLENTRQHINRTAETDYLIIIMIIIMNFNGRNSHGNHGSKRRELAQHAHSHGSHAFTHTLYINTVTTTWCEAPAQLLHHLEWMFYFEGTWFRKQKCLLGLIQKLVELVSGYMAWAENSSWRLLWKNWLEMRWGRQLNLFGEIDRKKDNSIHLGKN